MLCCIVCLYVDVDVLSVSKDIILCFIFMGGRGYTEGT
jgi:hypothetical protein